MPQSNNKKEVPSEFRMVVEVNGNPVGFLNLDIDRLWPIINHRKTEEVPVEWIDAAKFESVMRATVMKRLMTRLETHMYKALGDEMVKAELDVEAFNLKVEAAAQTLGQSKKDIEELVSETDATPMDLYSFFWEYLLDDRDVIDLKKEWKARSTRPR